MNTLTGHLNLDAKRLAVAKIVAEKVRKDPRILNEVILRLKEWRDTIDPRSLPYVNEWERICALSLNECLDFLASETDKGTAFRQVNPFARVLNDKEIREFNIQWNIDNFGSAGAFGDATKVIPIGMKELKHLVSIIKIMPEFSADLYLIGEQVHLFNETSSKNNKQSNKAVFGAWDIKDFSIEFWESFGKNSPFHTVHGYYFKLIDLTRLTLRSGWKERVKRLVLEDVPLVVLHPDDAVSSKDTELHSLP